MNAALLILAGAVAGQQPCPPVRYVPAIREPNRPANFYMNLYGSPRPQYQPQLQFEQRPDLLPILRYISDQNQQILMALLARNATGTQLYAVPGQMPAPPCGDSGPQMERRLSPEQLPTQPPQYQPPGQQLPYPRPCQPAPTPYAAPGYEGYSPGPAARLQPPVGYQRYTIR